jgi:uncharacterized Tic20 family protein
MAETPPDPGPPPIEPEPYDRESDAQRGARVRDVGDQPPPSGSRSSGRAWAMACHLGGLAHFANFCFLLGLGILVPLVIWLSQRDLDPFVDEHGKESVNFQINVLFWWLIFTGLSICCVGIPFLVALHAAQIVLAILASIEAAEGRPYRYPLIVRLLR